MRLLIFLSGIGLALCAVSRVTQRSLNVDRSDQGGYSFSAEYDGTVKLVGRIGRQISSDDSEVHFDVSTDTDETGAWKISVLWDGPSDRVFEDCFDFGSNQWYGGPEQKDQYWPIQNGRLQRYSYISKEDDNAAVAERYWLNSEGTYFYVHSEVPLFVDYHNIEENQICFIAEVTAPYSQQRTHNILKYDIWFFANPKLAHEHAVNTYLGKPSGIPDYRMIQYPIYSTWARYAAAIDTENLRVYANEIAETGFPNSQFEIDDLWEICYGSLTVDERKLPNFGQLIQDIKAMGFRVTIWAHPFINRGCEPWYSDALANGYFVLNEEGNPETSWWNDNGTVTAQVDFTNPEASAWWVGRVQDLIQTYDIDSVKFDAGESSWSPQIPVQNGDIDLHPSHIVETYLRAIAEFGPMIEVRSGMRTQDLPIFVRMVDKDTEWGFNNGLATLITTLLQMNLNGYTLVLPDMIGGNGYTEDWDIRQMPDRELFVRWLQANVFMPSMQYSFVPWDYDAEVIEIALRYTHLHAEYADAIVAAMQASVTNGTPVNAPLWWLDPTDQEALAIWDQFLLGEDIIAAPVVQQGAVTRDIYLPVGSWRDGQTGVVIVGPTWLRDYPAPLDVLPYFVRA